MDNLKPCPFCGSTGFIKYKKALDEYVPECSNNDCVASYMIGNSFDTEEEAIAVWNHRVEGVLNER